MGRIVASVKIENPSDPNARIRCDAFVDTGYAFLVLPRQGQGVTTRGTRGQTRGHKGSNLLLTVYALLW